MVSKKIKGITIEIGADPTGLDKALKDVEKGANKVRSELREVNSAMKNAPESAVLWTQKQNLLTKAIEESKKKLDFLKNAQEQVEKQFRNKEIGEEQYRAFQREVEKAGAELKYFEDTLSDFECTAKNASDDMRKLGDSAEDAGEQAEESGDGFTILKGTIANLAADGINKAINSFKELASEGDTALDTLQAKTGATAEQMKEYRDIMTNLFGNNYGENKTDIADSIAAVKQQLGNISSEELEEVTEQALLLRDTFGYEVSESIRTAKMLMDQFELSAAEAYTLIAQGAQNGLDKNGDLLDTVNEYAVHYKQLGYNSEEFFNSLKNGTDAGTFSVDKLGDAMKEFGIRSKDTAKSTDEAYAVLGVNAEQMRTAFAEGGESARAATETILTALFSMEDKVKQNQTGVNLFGTMWEDLGADGIKALSDINGQADKTASTLDDINNIRYDNIGSQTTSLKRKIETELYEPLIKKLIPKAEKGIDTITRNLPEMIDSGKKLIPVVKGAGAAFAAWKIANTVKPGATAVKSLFDSVKKGNSIMNIFNSTLKSNPIATVTTAVGVAATAIDYFSGKIRISQSELDKFVDKQNKYQESARNSVDEIRNLREEADKNSIKINIEYDDIQKKWNELQTLVDQNGKIKEGYESRVNYITHELTEATGVEIELINGQIQKYGELKNTIEDTIEKQRALRLFDSYSANEAEYIEKREEAKTEVNKRRQEVDKAWEDYKTAESKVSLYEKGYDVDGVNDLGVLKNRRDEAKKMYDEAKESLDSAKEIYFASDSEINRILHADELIAEGRYSEATKYMTSLNDQYKQTVADVKSGEDEKVEAYKNSLKKFESDIMLAKESYSKANEESSRDSIETVARSLAEMTGMMLEKSSEHGTIYSENWRSVVQELLNSGMDFNELEAIFEAEGINLGEILGRSITSGVSGFSNAIANTFTGIASSIFSYIKDPQPLPMFADGGFLRKGQGIVAEEGPELIEIVNGGARITPLTSGARNTAVSGPSGNNSRITYINNTINATISGDYDVRRIAEKLSDEQRNAERNMGL